MLTVLLCKFIRNEIFVKIIMEYTIFKNFCQTLNRIVDMTVQIFKNISKLIKFSLDCFTFSIYILIFAGIFVK